jgi:hypothetical protein
VTPGNVVAFLRFWESFPEIEGHLDAEAKKALRVRLEKLDDKSLATYTEFLRGRYDEQQASAASVASRGGSLFVFVGLLTTGATILAGLATPANPFLLWPVLVLGFFLLYATFAAAFLAVRSQQVSMWAVPRLSPEDATSKRALNLTFAVELMAAVEQNKKTQRHLVAYLRDGQLWARLVLLLVVLLAPIPVIAAATTPRAATASATASPPVTSAPSPSPLTTPAP